MGVRILQPVDAEVIVVGAGPAGAAAAYHLARAGVDVLVLDRSAFPRDKVCGDFLGPVALAELAAMGLPRQPAYLETNVIRRASLYLDGKRLISRPFPSATGLPGYGRVIPRQRLDSWLVERACQAGARLVERVRVTSLAAAADSIVVESDGQRRRPWRARIVIGADGSHSACARFLWGAPHARRDRIFAVRAYMDDCPVPVDEAQLFFSSKLFPGYYWLFPTEPGSANVGLGVVRDSFPPWVVHLEEDLRTLLRQDPAMKRLLRAATMREAPRGWPLNTYNPSAPLVGPRLMLAGDAAGLVNPLNGEGIQYALLSGRLAAEVAAGCLRAGRFAELDLRPYQDRIREGIGRDLALARLLIRTISNRSLNPFWLEALRLICSRARLDREYASRTGGALAGTVPVREVLCRKVIAGTLEQAALSWGLRALWTMVRGPSAWAKAALGACELAFGVSVDLAAHPKDFWKWSIEALEAAAAAAPLRWRSAGS